MLNILNLIFQLILMVTLQEEDHHAYLLNKETFLYNK